MSLGYEAGAGGCAVKGGKHALDVLWGQPIKLAQVASTSELREKSKGTTFFSLKLFLVISAGPQKYKHKIGHN